MVVNLGGFSGVGWWIGEMKGNEEGGDDEN